MRRVTWNIATGTLNTLLNAFSGLITLPLIIGTAGAEFYGVWALIVAVAGYFTLLDFGVAAATGRLIAGFRDDAAACNRILSTSVFGLFAGGGVVALLTLACAHLFPLIFTIPHHLSADAQAAILVVGMTTALYFPAAAFDGLLWGHERFDIINGAEIAALMVRTGLIVGFAGPTMNLLDLAWMFSIPTVAAYLVRGAVCWWVAPGLQLSPFLFSRETAGRVVSFGGWLGLLNLLRSSLPQIATFGIGYCLGPLAVTVFTIPRLLVAYASWILASATQVVAPRAAVFHFGERAAEQRELYRSATGFALLLSIYLVGGMILLGAGFIALWQPLVGAVAYPLLIILALGELLPLSQWVTYNVAISTGKHRWLAGLAGVELIALALAMAATMPYFGLTGVAISMAVLAFACRGVVQIAYGCHIVGINLLEQVWRVIIPAAIPGLLTLLLCRALRLDWTADSWTGFIIAGALYTLIYSILATPWLLGKARQSRTSLT